MPKLKLFLGLSLLLVLVSACAAVTPAPTPLPTPDAKATETRIAANIFATQTASVPTSTNTPAATNTPRLTDTPRPTATNPATATPERPALEILSSDSYVSGSYTHVIGEVRNNSVTPMTFVKIVVTFYDDAGGLTNTDFSYTELDAIPAGGRSPFELLSKVSATAKKFKLQVQGRPGVLGRQDLVVESQRSFVQGTYLHIVGQVKNTGNAAATFVKVVATFYSKSEQVVGQDFTYTTLDTVLGGGTSPFEILSNHFPNFDHYSLQVQGR